MKNIVATKELKSPQQVAKTSSNKHKTDKAKKNQEFDERTVITLKDILKASKFETDKRMAKFNHKVAILLGQQEPAVSGSPQTIPKNEGLGIAGMILGIVGIFFAGIILGILALIFGIVSLSKIEKYPEK